MSHHLRQLHHVGIVVQNLEASIDWYERHLNFRRLSDSGFPGARMAFIGRGSLKLELFQVDGAQPMVREREQPATNLKIGGINHFAIGVDNLDQTIAELEAAGIEIALLPHDVSDGSGDRFAFIRDNERMLIELFQPAD